MIHRAIEIVLKRAKTSDGSTALERMIAVVRDLGGLSSLIDAALDEILCKYENNPRMTVALERYRLGQAVLPSSVRTFVQSMLRDISRSAGDIGNVGLTHASRSDSSSKELSPGVHAEVTLSATGFDWFGQIDLLSISSDYVVIEDIKTGAEKAEHVQQVLIYAWLWWRDSERNPKGRTPTQLRVRYLDQVVDVPVPGDDSWPEFEGKLVKRTAEAIAKVSVDQCEACPNTDVCRYCSVRQLCDAYWIDVVSIGQSGSQAIGDLQGKLVSVLSSKTWQLKVTASDHFNSDSLVLLRGPLPKSAPPNGSRIRVLDAKFSLVSSYDDEDVPTVQLMAGSELFVGSGDIES